MTQARALILCAVKGSKNDASKEFVAAGIGMLETACQGDCGRTLVYSQRTADKTHGMDVDLMCNECARPRAIAAGLVHGPMTLGILPGTLPGDTPYERRRRNELEARGFRDLDPSELAKE